MSVMLLHIKQSYPCSSNTVEEWNKFAVQS